MAFLFISFSSDENSISRILSKIQKTHLKFKFLYKRDKTEFWKATALIFFCDVFFGTQFFKKMSTYLQLPVLFTWFRFFKRLHYLSVLIIKLVFVKRKKKVNAMFTELFLKGLLWSA